MRRAEAAQKLHLNRIKAGRGVGKGDPGGVGVALNCGEAGADQAGVGFGIGDEFALELARIAVGDLEQRGRLRGCGGGSGEGATRGGNTSRFG